MTLFNADAWIAYKTGQVSGYRFADPQRAVAKYSDADRKTAARSEYRQGLINTAQGSISIFDKNDDGKLSAREYYREQNYFHQRATGGINADRNAIMEEFDCLDINGDGFIDYKERANELSYLDRTKESNSNNGVITADGEMREARQLLRGNLAHDLDYNYDTYKMENLGEVGDIDKDLTLKTSNPFGQRYDRGYGNSDSMLGLIMLMMLMGNSSNSFGMNNGCCAGSSSISSLIPMLLMLGMFSGQQYSCY